MADTEYQTTKWFNTSALESGLEGLKHGLKKKANPIKYTKLEIRQNVNNDFHNIKYQRKKESQFMSGYTVW